MESMVASVPMDAPAITSEKLRNFPAAEKRTVEILAEALTSEIDDLNQEREFDDASRAGRLSAVLKDFLDLCEELNGMIDTVSGEELDGVKDELRDKERDLDRADDKIEELEEEIEELKKAAK